MRLQHVYHVVKYYRCLSLTPYSDYDLITLRTEPDIRPEPVLSRTQWPFFSTNLHEVCEEVLPQIIVKRAMKQIVCRTHGTGPHLVYRPSLQGA